MKAAMLADRGVVSVRGEDARKFLDGLVTTDVDRVTPEAARFGALLTPQGKITADFFIAQAATPDSATPEELLIDCDATLAQALTTKLGFYKLRAKVTVENLSDRYEVIALWDGEPPATSLVLFADPRDPRLGHRMIALDGAVDMPTVEASAYEAHRIACGAPRGGVDFLYGDAFPHEANMDRLHGVDFDKGCYVGQEVVSRMQHRGTARTRIVGVAFDAPPPQGAAITSDGKPLGTMGSAADHRGLALLRIDRVSDALDAGADIVAGDIAIRIADPAALRLPPKHVA